MRQPLLRAAAILAAALCLLLSLLAPASAATRSPLAAWLYSRKITSPGQAQYVRLTIPDEVAAHSRADLTDLRLADQDANEVPYTTVAGPGTRPDVIYYRASGKRYWLLYGNQDAARPAYGVEWPANPQTEPGALAPEAANPVYDVSNLRDQTWPRRYPLPFYTFFFGLIILLFGYMYRRTVGRVKSERKKIARLLELQRNEENKP